ncbi:hypothetical protein [Streptomyces sp. NPDC058622]|uniref:hypothetical protein n=1 Tax=Streptomyces sp. NPDC058622 TaxID=3346562 RepID=UPI003661F123
MSHPTGLSPEAVDALHRLKDQRDVNTVILHCAPAPHALEVELVGNLTHEELLQALPQEAERLVVHELAFATREGSRRHETVLILWAPAEAGGQEEPCTEGYTALKEFLTDTRMHLTAGQKDQLDYRRLVALNG